MLKDQTQSLLQWIKVKIFTTNGMPKANLNYTEKKPFRLQFTLITHRYHIAD